MMTFPFFRMLVADATIGLFCASLGLAATGPAQYLKQADAWFASDEAQCIAANILAHQSVLGGWPKNLDTTAALPANQDRGPSPQPTFDNGATTDELRFLARSFAATKEERYRHAFLKGYDYILRAQYPSGGWPQFYPPDRKYHRHITFNDNAMVRLLEFLRETYTSPRYVVLDEGRQRQAREAFDKGLDCILQCQIKVNGQRTAWCAQHDEQDYRPRPGRAYELPSISGAESVGIVRLLMSLDNPRPEIVQAVEGAVAWFQAAGIPGIRVIQVEDQHAPQGLDKRVIADPSAPLIWARFYEIGTNQPLVCDRDGVAKHHLSEIGYERRNGYAWLGSWPQSLLTKDYPAWQQKRQRQGR